MTEEALPTALASTEQGTSTEVVATPPVEAAEAATVAKRERDRLAERGRELAAARKAAQEAQQLAVRQQTQIQELQQQIGGLHTAVADTRRREWETYFQTLPPEQQALERVKLLEQRVAQPPPTPQPVAQLRGEPDQEGRLEYQRRRSAEILATLSEAYDLSDDPLTGSETALNWSSEDEFLMSAKQIARERRGERDVAAKKPAPAPTKTAEHLRSEIKAEVMQELGVGRPNSPRPAGGSHSSATPEDLQKEMWKYDSKRGPRGTMDRLRALRAQAEEG